MNDNNIIDGEIILEDVSAPLPEPDELRKKVIREFIEELGAVDSDFATLLEQKAAAILPGNDENAGTKFEGVRIWRVMPGGDVRYVLNEFPNDCPIKPLGKDSEGNYYFLDSTGDLISSNIKGQTELENLFGKDNEYLYRGWLNTTPKSDGNKIKHTFKGYHAQYARQCLIKECSLRGHFDPQNKVRGRGAWRTDAGKLVLHVGDAILMGETAEIAGEYENYIYPSRAALPRPIAGTGAEMAQLLERLKKWNWGRPDKDPLLLLGWFGCAILTAALDWRPSVFVDAAAGSGKSTLQKTIDRILGGRVHSMVGASEAAIRAAQGIDAIVVALDEAEPDPNDPERGSKIMELARVAASGGRILRGTKDQKVKEFILRAGFIFTAVNIPKMTQADTQRFAFLKLLKPPKGAKRLPELTIAEGEEIGQKLAGRMVRAFDRLDQMILDYRELLEEQEHDPRGSEHFGTLLAVADCVLYDEYDAERAAEWAKTFNAKNLEEYEEREENWFTAFRAILQAQPEVWRGNGFPSVGQKIKEYLVEEMQDLIPADHEYKPDFEGERKKIKDMLEKTGLSLVQGSDGNFWLCVPNAHPQTRKLFQGTTWAGGNWSKALQQSPKWNGESGIYRTQQVVMGGVRPNCTLINLNAQYDFGDGNGMRQVFAIE